MEILGDPSPTVSEASKVLGDPKKSIFRTLEILGDPSPTVSEASKVLGDPKKSIFRMSEALGDPSPHASRPAQVCPVYEMKKSKNSLAPHCLSG